MGFIATITPNPLLCVRFVISRTHSQQVLPTPFEFDFPIRFALSHQRQNLFVGHSPGVF